MASDAEKKILRRTRRAMRSVNQDRELEKRKPGQELKQTDIVAFNQSAETHAVAFLEKRIQDRGPQRFNTACDLIALELDVSVETAKRYLRKYSVDHPKAKFCIQDGYVTTRSR